VLRGGEGIDVAVMPERYCSNCGHELSPADQFCPNCGSPVHRAAHVPTPEADVPVPPPPQAGGAAPAPPEQQPAQEQPAQQAGWGRRHPILTGCLGIIGLFVLVIIIAAALSGGGDETAGGGGGGDAVEKVKQKDQKAAQQEEKPQQEQAQNQEQQPRQQGGGAQEPEQQKPSFGDGTYQVGTDVQPGTYRTREGSTNCYYERLKDFTGGMNSIIANGNTNAPAIVTIKITDAGFNSQGCGTWTKDLSAITASKTSFGAGTYIVGTDFEPGTYRSSGGNNCYYERLRDFTGGMNSIIANGNTNNPTIVTIAPTDAGFQSQNCGTWTKLE
jgi:hypothetical protein